LFVIALTGTLGKTLATLLTYWVADKLEDFLTHSKIGKILGVDKEEIENILPEIFKNLIEEEGNGQIESVDESSLEKEK